MIASWHVNFVRLLLNEDCWLGINGIKRQYSGARYRQAIVNHVGLLHGGAPANAYGAFVKGHYAGLAHY